MAVAVNLIQIMAVNVPGNHQKNEPKNRLSQ
ncbi:hypothetical protein C7M51_03483 [Mixta intestinalis]|uniref:Uncharacterized protein n=1 Tax=Mixta intestinalis TaxID=1615494 RepID=A0A6P1Q5C7_9GAMM|nr:hypothetical protein C7M51_03483 [Mixta intestinalis]